jgi:hypothetical protein
MRRLLLVFVLLLTCSAFGQYMGIGSVFPTASTAAATPTFSPAAGAVSNPTTVTASTATVDGCTMYLDTSNPPTTAQSTYSVTTGVTLYAQAKGCSTHTNSAVASAAYTITCTSGACSDSFSGTVGTLLTTHDANWQYNSGGAGNARLQLDGSGNIQGVAAVSLYASIYYSASTSQTSTVVWKASDGANSPHKGPCVNMSATANSGYCAINDVNPPTGGNFGHFYMYKNQGDPGLSADAINFSFSATTDLCVSLARTGTTPATLTLSTAPYSGGVCGSFTSKGSITDLSSTLTGGSPGMLWDYSINQFNTLMGAWRDYQ